MAFERQQNVTITGYGDIDINLFVPGTNNPEGVQSGTIAVQLTLSNGGLKQVKYDLLARLQDDAAGQAHAVALSSLKDYILARVASEALP